MCRKASILVGQIFTAPLCMGCKQIHSIVRTFQGEMSFQEKCPTPNCDRINTFYHKDFGKGFKSSSSLRGGRVKPHSTHKHHF